MTVHEIIGAAGAWEIKLWDAVPDEVFRKIQPFGHVAIIKGRVDVDADTSSLLRKARYVGVVRRTGKASDRTIGGPGMITWLGDEDEKGKVIETTATITNDTLANSVAAVIPPAVTVGTIFPLSDPTKRYTGKFRFVTPRTALGMICDAFDVEYRVNGDGTLDVGRQDQLYTAVPDSIIVRKGAGTDLDLVALGGTFDTQIVGDDYSTRALLLGTKIGSGTTPDLTFVTARVDAASVPFVDIHGNRVYLTRMISESSTDNPVNATKRAQMFLNQYNRLNTTFTVTAEDYEIDGNFRCGDNTFVYDPDNGIVNPAYERTFRAELLHPDIVRVSEVTWPVSDDYTVAYRAGDGTWTDLTRYVNYETGTTSLVVGDLPKSLTSAGKYAISDRADSGLIDKIAPKAPTGLGLTTNSVITGKGTNSAVITANWTAPTQNADNTDLTDLAYYLAQYRRTGTGTGAWQSVAVNDVTVDLPAAVALSYDVRVAAVDQSNNVSPYTATATIVSAADTVAPPAPIDPVVTSYLGQLRIEYGGTDNLGNPMPTDANRIDVFVDTTTGFTPTAANRVSSLNPFAKGVAYATAPYGVPRFVRFVAYDHSGNASAISGTATASTTQVADGDIASMNVGKLTAGTITVDIVNVGRVTTALTGARREVNSIGFQAFDSSNNLLINLDGVNNLLTGILKTALTGRRIEIGSSGNVGQIMFVSPAGQLSYLESEALVGGNEGISVRMPLAGKGVFWNSFRIDTSGLAFLDAKYTHFGFGGTPGGGGDFRVAFATSTGTSTTFPTLVDRLYIDEDIWEAWYNTSGGFFVVSEKNLSSGVDVIRQQMWGGGAAMFTKSPGTEWAVQERAVGGGSFDPRFRLLDNAVYFQFPAPKDGRLFEINVGPVDSAGTYFSPEWRMLTSIGYGCFFRFQTGASGSGSKVVLRDAADSIYEDLFVGTLTQSSTRENKRNTKALPFSATEKLATIKPVTYNRKTSDGWEDTTTVGIIAEDAQASVPEIVTDSDHGPGISVLSYAVLIMASLQEAIARIEKLEKGKP